MPFCIEYHPTSYPFELDQYGFENQYIDYLVQHHAKAIINRITANCDILEDNPDLLKLLSWLLTDDMSIPDDYDESTRRILTEEIIPSLTYLKEVGDKYDRNIEDGERLKLRRFVAEMHIYDKYGAKTLEGIIHRAAKDQNTFMEYLFRLESFALEHPSFYIDIKVLNNKTNSSITTTRLTMDEVERSLRGATVDMVEFVNQFYDVEYILERLEEHQFNMGLSIPGIAEVHGTTIQQAMADGLITVIHDLDGDFEWNDDFLVFENLDTTEEFRDGWLIEKDRSYRQEFSSRIESSTLSRSWRIVLW